MTLTTVLATMIDDAVPAGRSALPPPTQAQLIAAIGRGRRPRSFLERFRSRLQVSEAAYLLASQIGQDWLRQLDGVALSLLLDEDARSPANACGTC